MPVDDQRKNAYRYLLYLAMLDIRPLGWMSSRWFSAWNPFYWRREGQRIRYAGAVADWLHNMAFFSTIDFVGFNEEWFWRDFERLRSDYPQFNVESFRTIIDEYTETTASPITSPPGTSQ